MYKPFAEIIQSSITSSTIQCWQWNEVPELGSLITIQTKKQLYFGIINMIQLGSGDPTRQPYAYQKTEEELLAEQPQVFQFLQTTCTYVPVGFQENTTLYYQLPPTPPNIHSFIACATPEQYQSFFATELYLPFLLQQQGIAHEELLLAVLRKRLENNALTHASLLQCIDVFAYHCNDYRKLRLFLQRIEATHSHFQPLSK
jgi:hypothetical protein